MAQGGVVYLLIPTSNHNRAYRVRAYPRVVYLLIPTSNHNILTVLLFLLMVVYLLIPTSNHNKESIGFEKFKLYIF